MPTLEYAIHQENGNTERTKNWIERFEKNPLKVQELLEQCLFKDFVVFDGSKITVIINNNYKYA